MGSCINMAQKLRNQTCLSYCMSEYDSGGKWNLCKKTGIPFATSKLSTTSKTSATETNHPELSRSTLSSRIRDAGTCFNRGLGATGGPYTKFTRWRRESTSFPWRSSYNEARIMVGVLSHLCCLALLAEGVVALLLSDCARLFCSSSTMGPR